MQQIISSILSDSKLALISMENIGGDGPLDLQRWVQLWSALDLVRLGRLFVIHNHPVVLEFDGSAACQKQGTVNSPSETNAFRKFLSELICIVQCLLSTTITCSNQIQIRRARDFVFPMKRFAPSTANLSLLVKLASSSCTAAATFTLFVPYVCRESGMASGEGTKIKRRRNPCWKNDSI